jgi:hypothetical protein
MKLKTPRKRLVDHFQLPAARRDFLFVAPPEEPALRAALGELDFNYTDLIGDALRVGAFGLAPRHSSYSKKRGAKYRGGLLKIRLDDDLRELLRASPLVDWARLAAAFLRAFVAARAEGGADDGVDWARAKDEPQARAARQRAAATWRLIARQLEGEEPGRAKKSAG